MTFDFLSIADSELGEGGAGRLGTAWGWWGGGCLAVKFCSGCYLIICFI